MRKKRATQSRFEKIGKKTLIASIARSKSNEAQEGSVSGCPCIALIRTAAYLRGSQYGERFVPLIINRAFPGVSSLKARNAQH